MRYLPALLISLAGLAASCGTKHNNVCLERVHALEEGGEPARAQAALLLEQAQGAHAAMLSWHDGTRTHVTFELPEAEAKWVTSRRNPDNHTDIAANCRDRVRLIGQATLRTDDGRLDERFETLALDETAEGGLHAWFARGVGGLQGTYVRQSQGGKLSGLNFQIELGAELFHGALFENIKSESGETQTSALGLWDDEP
jgi:hypothetical protein